MNGAWVFVCGPSGAGKDSVMGWARERLAGHPAVVFAQRLETRPCPPGPDHLAIDLPWFDVLRRGAALAWHWQANGCHYGIPGRYAQQVGWGRLVVVNGSREHVAGLAPGPSLRIVQVTASPAQLATRLSQRGRDTPAAIAGRLLRNSRLTAVQACLAITNDGKLDAAGQRLADFLLSGARIMQK